MLLFGWYAEGTGFTRVLREVLPYLARHYRITWMGVGYKGEPRQLGPDVLLLPTNVHGGDMVGAYAARLHWASIEADAILALNDVWYLEHYSRELAGLLGRVPMVGYCPLDGDIPEPRLIEGLVGFHTLYTYTEHAAGQLRGALRACGIATRVAVAGHGVDRAAFAPSPAVRVAGFDATPRMHLAQQLFGLSEPAWVVLNASRPDPRKRIDLSIEGFARFSRGLPASVRLCLHQAIAFPQFVEPLRQQAAALGLEDRILWWPPREEPLDDRALCALYNACTVGINTSVGEGFGLVSFEHGATGAPQVLPDHASLRELWGNAAVRLGPVRPVRTAFSPLVMGEVDASQVSEGLARLYESDHVYRGFARAAYERCQSDDLRWSVPAEVLVSGLREAISAGDPAAQ